MFCVVTKICYNFDMKVSSSLKKLAKEFEKRNHHLYIVGGFVRDTLLGYTPSDIDITSSMPCEEVEEIANTLGFTCKVINKHLGTLQIRNSKEEYEYTRFRTESYADNSHTPSKVQFVDKIEVDCLRRDFTINSIYYDIHNDEIIDLCNGQKDLEKKIIRTVNKPMLTLKDDGLRILRAIRFASTFNFKIEKNTLKALNFYKTNLLNISKERILKEIKYCVVADIKYGINNTIFWNNILYLDLLPIIFNHSLHRKQKIDKESINNFYLEDEDNRLTDFYFIVIRSYIRKHAKHPQLSYIVNMLLGIDGIKESSAIIRLIEKIYLIYENIEYDIDTLNASINYLGLTPANKNIIYKHLSKKAKLRLDNNILLVEGKNLPTSIDKLKITAKDLIDHNIEPRFISSILNTLFNQVIELKVKNEKSDLINLATEIHKTFTKINSKENRK